MVVAVTGASGFIGRHVLAELRGKRVDVVAVTRDAARLKKASSGIRVVEMNLAVPEPDAFVRMGCPDVLIHLAWDGLPNYKSPHHVDAELPKQYGFLRSLVASGLGSLLVAGTCFEYGMHSGALSEEVTPCPNTSYGCAKDTLRRQLEILKSANPFNLTWCRLFYMYGEGQSAASLYSLLKDAVKRGDAVFNMSGGEQLRDYLPVTEVARGIVGLALSGRDLGIVNICSGKPISVRGLIEQWLFANGWKIELNLGYYPYPEYEPMAFWGDAAKFHEAYPLGE